MSLATNHGSPSFMTTRTGLWSNLNSVGSRLGAFRGSDGQSGHETRPEIGARVIRPRPQRPGPGLDGIGFAQSQANAVGGNVDDHWRRIALRHRFHRTTGQQAGGQKGQVLSRGP